MTPPSTTPSTRAAAVVIVNYRAYEELAACLASIASHDRAEEVVVIDHASSPENRHAMRVRFPWVRWIVEPGNPGFAAAVNRGIRACDSPHVLLLNPDCVLTAPVRKPLSDYLDATRAVGVLGPRLLNRDGSLQPSGRRFPDVTTVLGGRRSWLTARRPGNWFTRRNMLVSAADRAPRVVDWVSGACMMVRREAFEQVGGMDEGFFLYWEDVDFCRRMHAAGWRVDWHPGATLTHTGAGSSRSVPYAALVAFHRSAFRYYCKYAGPLGRCAVPVVAAALTARLLMAIIATRLWAAWGSRHAPTAQPASPGA